MDKVSLELNNQYFKKYNMVVVDKAFRLHYNKTLMNWQ